MTEVTIEEKPGVWQWVETAPEETTVTLKMSLDTALYVMGILGTNSPHSTIIDKTPATPYHKLAKALIGSYPLSPERAANQERALQYGNLHRRYMNSSIAR